MPTVWEIMQRMAGLEELDNDKDVDFLRGTLRPDDDDEQAAQHLRGKVEESLSTLMTKINWTAHIVAHS